jgi:hypothetical protein
MVEEESKEQKGKKTKEDEKVTKINIERKIADGLVELVERVNDGFMAGRVHRQSVVAWIISNFLKNYTDSDLNQIREAHYDDSFMLDAISKRVKETGDLPEFLRDALRKHFRSASDVPKKAKKKLTDKYTDNVHLGNEDAA